MDATTRLDEIAVFVHVVQAGSFTAAARQRGVPKSTLSRALTRLEEAIGARLLRRSSRRVALTDAGRLFFARAAPHVAGLLDAAEAALDRDDEPRGTLRLTAPLDTGDAFLGELLVRFTTRYPRLRVEVDLSTRQHNLLEAGFDVAIRGASRIEDGSLVARRIMGTQLHFFASPAYVARRGAPTAPEDLEGHDCVLFHPVDGRNDWLLQGPFGERRVTVSGRLGGSDFAFIRAALRAGGGIGPLPAFLAGRDLADGSLVRVLSGWGQAAGTMYIVYPAAQHVPRKVTAFRDFVLESIEQLARGGGTI
jgi:DNA-binding transcriptional LysR family regulator